MDFTVKCEQAEEARDEPDMADMAAFIASATAAVRNAGGNSFQVVLPLLPTLVTNSHNCRLSATGKKGCLHRFPYYTRRPMNYSSVARRINS